MTTPRQKLVELATRGLNPDPTEMDLKEAISRVCRSHQDVSEYVGDLVDNRSPASYRRLLRDIKSSHAPPPFQRHKVIIEPDDDHFLLMFEDGTVVQAASVKAAAAKISTRDRKTTPDDGATVTTIEWRGMPAGFQPPQE